ncbi:nucleolar snRNP protein (nucleomorph) [Chroomonas mesostigmatica CCMP1168]|uniref:Nucleolar snRNP protein n=1 Tax=Chroomonas mesostigmatica CCMP1168 TaxID=1195612 RepID=J7G8T3_9CRYP|nr:nucleolar snRNP protein [Chroomonas mesostigmatica CCMP1168]|mmetsp:Transcript_38551/g.94839  ORF Transcript_38551/g.94839 Transcript_38551/m.94839 type:complete len:421 (-) Transcript_38551:586-1848(-)
MEKKKNTNRKKIVINRTQKNPKLSQNFNIFHKNLHKNFHKKKIFLNNPLVDSFSGHRDGIVCIQRHNCNSSLFFSGSSDGEIRFWLLNSKKCVKFFPAHNRFVRKIGVDYKGKFLLSCSDDNTLKLWNICQIKKPTICFKNKNNPFTTLDNHPSKYFFTTGGKELLLWDQLVFRPIQKLIWGISSISCIKFNPEEPNIVCSSNSDRSLVLYDLRLIRPVNKISLDMCSNDITWNPSFFTEFTIANEDSNLYTFDLRNPKETIKTHTEHVMSILCVDSNINNSTIVTGSADNTIRFFDNHSYKNLDIYFTERMRRVTDLKFSLDGNYLISGSDDGNLRVWNNNFLKISQFSSITNQLSFDDAKFNNKKFINPVFFSNFYLLPKLVRTLERLKKILKNNQIKKKKEKNSHALPGYLRFNFKI